MLNEASCVPFIVLFLPFSAAVGVVFLSRVEHVSDVVEILKIV